MDRIHAGFGGLAFVLLVLVAALALPGQRPGPGRAPAGLPAGGELPPRAAAALMPLPAPPPTATAGDAGGPARAGGREAGGRKA